MKKHVFEMRIYAEDTDCFGIVYHANYLSYMSRARGEWLREMGYSVAEMQKRGYMFPIRSANLDYLRPARLGDLLKIETHIIKLGHASFTCQHEVFIADNPEVICRAQIKLAFIDNQMRPCAFPKELADVMAQWR